jgi:hypothetical protein
MSALTKPVSLDEFIAWEEIQELRYEYDRDSRIRDDGRRL